MAKLHRYLAKLFAKFLISEKNPINPQLNANFCKKKSQLRVCH